MPAWLFVCLSGTLTFGVPLALAAHELIGLRRRPGEPPQAPPKPLPPCLIPRPGVVARERELELV